MALTDDAATFIDGGRHPEDLSRVVYQGVTHERHLVVAICAEITHSDHRRQAVSLVKQHDVREPYLVRGHSDLGDTVVVLRVPLHLEVCPFLEKV